MKCVPLDIHVQALVDVGIFIWHRFPLSTFACIAILVALFLVGVALNVTHVFGCVSVALFDDGKEHVSGILCSCHEILSMFYHIPAHLHVCDTCVRALLF